MNTISITHNTENICETKQVFERTYYMSSFTQLVLPYTKPTVNTLEKTYSSGNKTYTTYISGGKAGLPYGRYPRLLLMFACTVLILSKTNRKVICDDRSQPLVDWQQRRIYCGKGFSSLCRYMGISTGGRVRKELQKQAEKLCTMSYIVKTKDGSMSVTDNFHLLRRVVIDDKKTHQNFIEFSLDVFDRAVGKHAIPINYQEFSQIKSPRLMDLYVWAKYRYNYLNTYNRRQLKFSWRTLMQQFSTEYNQRKLHKFKGNTKPLLEQLHSKYGFDIEISDKYVTLRRSKADTDSYEVFNPNNVQTVYSDEVQLLAGNDPTSNSPKQITLRKVEHETGCIYTAININYWSDPYIESLDMSQKSGFLARLFSDYKKFFNPAFNLNDYIPIQIMVKSLYELEK